MASKVHHTEIAGFRELMTLLDVLQDPEKYRAQLDELEETRRRANAAVEARGIAGDVQQALVEAHAALDAAKQAQIVAEGEAVGSITAARERADQIVSAAACEAARMLAEAESKRSEAERLLRATSDRLLNVERRELEAREQVTSAQEMQQAAASVRAEFESRLAALRGALQAAE